MSFNAAIVFHDGVTRFIQVNPEETLLNAAFRQGVNLPLGCREGVCGSCRGLCESGQVVMEYVDEDALTTEEIKHGHVLSCQTRLSSDATFYFDVDSTVCNLRSSRYQSRVVDLRIVSATVAVLELELTDPQQTLKYLPGQYAELWIPGSEQARAYSYANAVTLGPETAQRLRFLIRLLPQGVMSDYLRQRCQIGDTIELEGPLGAFYLRQVERPLLFVAGGTGLSAFLGILEDMIQHEAPEQAIRLCYGVNHENELSETERLEQFCQQLPDFSYQVAVLNPSEHWQGEKGLVTDILDRDFLTQSVDAYLCGPPPMIDATQKWLQTETTGEHKVYFEKFISS